MQADNFDDFVALMNSMWVLLFNHEDFHQSKCTCPTWVRFAICKHVIGTAMSMRLLDCPPNKLSNKLKMPKDNRPRALAAKALTRQANYDRTAQSSSIPNTETSQSLLIDMQSSQTNSGLVALPSASSCTPSTESPFSSIPNAEADTSLTLQSSQTNSGHVALPSTSSCVPSTEPPSSRIGCQIAKTIIPSHTAKSQSSNQQNDLPQGTLVFFGAVLKAGSMSGQRMHADGKWSTFSTKNSSKFTREFASFVYIGGCQVVVSGGIQSQVLKKVSDATILLRLIVLIEFPYTIGEHCGFAQRKYRIFAFDESGKICSCFGFCQRLNLCGRRTV